MKERIQKIISKAGICSRRKAEILIEERRIQVNDKIALLGQKADLGDDIIKVDGHIISAVISYSVILINKPSGVICSCKDTHGRKTVLDLLPKSLQKGIYPIGRLDKDSRGALLLTNNGLLSLKLTHPKYNHEKTYEVWISGKPSKESIKKWRGGICINEKITRPALVNIIKKDNNKTLLKIVLSEGRNRQIRRVASELGHKVLDLKRVAISTIKLGDLDEGSWRKLQAPEWQNLLE